MMEWSARRGDPLLTNERREVCGGAELDLARRMLRADKADRCSLLARSDRTGSPPEHSRVTLP